MDLKEAVKKYRSSIAALQDRTKRKIPVLRAAVEEVHDVTRDLRDRVEVVRNTIQNTIQNHIRELEEQGRELIDQLESISNSKEKVRYRLLSAWSLLKHSNWEQATQRTLTNRSWYGFFA